MTPFVHEFYVNLRTGAPYERAKKLLSQGNALADKIVVHVQDCGSDVDLTGMGVSALVVRFDGQTVPLTGTIEDGAACIMLDKDSYAVPGEARVTVMLSAGEMVQTVLVLLLNVDTSQTSIVVDNGTIGDLTDLLGAIAEMKAAADEAKEAADIAKAAAADNAAKTDAAIKEINNTIVIEQSKNLFDRSSVSSGYYQPTTGAVSAMTGTTHCLIPVTAGTYTFAGVHTMFGSNVSRIPLFDSAEKYVKSVVGTVGDDITNAKIVTIIISDADVASGVRYAGYSQYRNMIGAAMFVSGDTYPTEYVPYYKYVRIPGLQIDLEDSSTIQPNILYGKAVVFDGDSICYAGNTSTDKVGAGWAGRIGDTNAMDWHNVGVSGGTITSGLYASNGAARHWLSTYIDTIYSKYPSLDYLIFEGGTNDADLLTTDQIGTLDPDDFSGEYDANTFYGALDTLFYKAVNYYPHAKIGFIIAQRMGTNAGGLARRRRYFERVIEACKKWSIPYIDLWEAGQLDPRLTVYYDPSISGSAAAAAAGKAYYDGQHMTTVGYDILSPKIEAWMRTL